MSGNQTLLLTGATGFVGRSLLPVLIVAGWKVRAVVRRRPEWHDSVEAEWIEVGDLADVRDWPALLAGIEAVVHLAGRAHVLNDAADDPEAEYMRANVTVTRQLAEAAAALGVRRFVYMSSIKAAGEESGARPLSERDPACPQDAYGRSKREAERVIAGIPAIRPISLRPPLVYGPGVRANFLRLIRWAERGIPLPFGRVRNHRSLIFVGNLADAVRAALASDACGEFFVTDGEAISTADMVRRLARALGRPARLVAVPVALLKAGGALLGRGAEVSRLTSSMAVDDAAFRACTGWKPPFSIDEGFAATIAAYRGGAT